MESSPHIRKGLAVGIILLFMVSTVTPMVIGYKTNSTEKYDKNALDAHRYPEGYPDTSFSYKSNVTTTVPSAVKEEPRNPVPLSEGPMESPWPMYSHDVHHTGLSPYSTSDNPLVEKWRFSLSSDCFYAGFILDSNGTIYGGSAYIYAVDSN
jgi:hypothetical protein